MKYQLYNYANELPFISRTNYGSCSFLQKVMKRTYWLINWAKQKRQQNAFRFLKVSLNSHNARADKTGGKKLASFPFFVVGRVQEAPTGPH